MSVFMNLYNFLDKIRRTSSEIEKQISSYGLSFPQIGRKDVGWQIEFPLSHRFIMYYYKKRDNDSGRFLTCISI